VAADQEAAAPAAPTAPVTPALKVARLLVCL